jgi:hypothetical protein
VTDIDVAVLERHVKDALAYAITTDADRFADTIEAIVVMGPVAVHGALCGWSGLSLHGFEQSQGPAPDGGFWGVEVEDVRTGKVVSIDQVSDPAMRDAARIVACVGNHDHDTIAAIIEASIQASDDLEALVALMVQSVKLAATIASHLHEKRGEAQP